MPIIHDLSSESDWLICHQGGGGKIWEVNLPDFTIMTFEGELTCAWDFHDASSQKSLVWVLPKSVLGTMKSSEKWHFLVNHDFNFGGNLGGVDDSASNQGKENDGCEDEGGSDFVTLFGVFEKVDGNDGDDENEDEPKPGDGEKNEFGKGGGEEGLEVPICCFKDVK